MASTSQKKTELKKWKLPMKEDCLRKIITHIGTLYLCKWSLISDLLNFFCSSAILTVSVCAAQDNSSSSNVARVGQKVGHSCPNPSNCEQLTLAV